MKNIFLLLLFIIFSDINAQYFSSEEIRSKGIKRMRVYDIRIVENGYSKPLYQKEKLVYEYTYDTNGRQTVSHYFYNGISSSLSYHTRIEKDSIFKFDSDDRPLVIKTSRIHIHDDVGKYKLSKLILIENYKYNDDLGIKEIHATYENGKTAYREFFYNTLKKGSYKTGHEKFDGKKKLIEQDIIEYDSLYRQIRSSKFDARYDKTPKVLSVAREEEPASINQTETIINSPVVTEIPFVRNQFPFFFNCNYKDSVRLMIECAKYQSQSYGDSAPEYMLHISLYHKNQLYESKDVLTSTLLDTNDLKEEFIKQLVYCSGNENNVSDIRKYDAKGNLRFTLKSRRSDDYYNGYYEYDFYDAAKQDKNAGYIDNRKNGNGKVVMYEDGKKYKEQNYLNYQLHGNSTTWYTNGVVSAVSEYSEDLLNGTSISYDTSGKVISKELYKDGAPLEYRIWNDSSEIVLCYFYISEKKGNGNILVFSHPFPSPLRKGDKKMIARIRKEKKYYLNEIRR